MVKGLLFKKLLFAIYDDVKVYQVTAAGKQIWINGNGC